MTTVQRSRARAKVARAPRALRWVRPLVIAALALALIPGVLVPLYAILNPVSTVMLYTRLAHGQIEREWVPLDEIAKPLVVAVMASEDTLFCRHHGVDWGELLAVIDDPDGPTRGASTIAMQTTRNLFLWTTRSYFRKAMEIPLALYADAVWDKRRMMEIYLNIAQWGPRIFGIEAAARTYFDRSANDLTPDQAVLLAVSLPNPIARDPAHPSPGLRSLATRIAARAGRMASYDACLYP